MWLKGVCLSIIMVQSFIKKIINDKEIDYRYDRLMINLKRIKPFSAVLIFYIIWLGILCAFYLLKEVKISVFLLPYILFFLLNILSLIISESYYKKIKKTPIKENKALKVFLLEAYIIFYILSIALFGAYISLLDQAQYDHIIVYIICLMSSICCFYLNYKQTLFIIILSVLMLVIGLPKYQPDQQTVLLHYANIVLFLPLSFLISRIIYSDYKSKYKYIQLLADETEKSKDLYKNLESANLLLTKLASIDELTNVANRRGLKHFFEISMEKIDDKGQLMSAFMVDIDFFKSYNDTYGHIKGDIILKKIAQTLSVIANEHGGFLSRWGGEEFAMIGFNIDAEKSIYISKAILKAVGELTIPHEATAISPFVTVSVGSCTMHVNSIKEINSAIEGADKALYYAKTQGKNCYRSFSFNKEA